MVTVERSVPPRVLQTVKWVLKDNASGLTTRDLAYALDISMTHMYQYVKRLHRLGLLEPAGIAPEPHWKGPQPKRWRWAG